MMDSIENWVAKDSFMENMKFLDFPMESVEENAYEEEGDWIANLQADQALGPIPFEFLSRYVNKNFDGDFGTSNEDALQLKKDGDGYESEVLFQPNSPISIFDNSNSGPIEKKLHIPFGTHIPRWARTKRSRASKINKWSFISPIISSTRSNHSNSSNIVKNAIQGENKKIPCGNKIEKKKFTHAVFLRRCSHCQVTKTPQWREGPMGPKTLCNACGVRYRSGRLFPEYCPRASPVFVPSLHSNSHKKVMEMRNKAS